MVAHLEPAKEFDVVLARGRIVDPAQGINKMTDLAIHAGKIAQIGDDLAARAKLVIDMQGYIVAPGLIDIHVHTYGILGFAYPDRIGIYQGVTTFVEAGGPGNAAYAEFIALLKEELITGLYGGAYIRPLGIVGLEYIEGDVRSLGNISIGAWMDLVAQHRDTLKYLKLGAFGNYGSGTLKLGKGLAEILGMPIYVHTGDFQTTPRETTTAMAYKIAERGDIITHLYHENPGNILDHTGKVLPEVKEAAQRGVQFDIGFGSFNFSFDIADKAMAQGVIPHILSSDLQQSNVTGPAYSLSNVMSIFLMLGLSLEEVIERVTIAPARALALTDRAGSLRPGAPADVTILKLEEGDFSFSDCRGRKRRGTQKLVPVMAFKDGVRYDSNLELSQDTRNWCLSISQDEIPAAAAALDRAQREFLIELARALEPQQWESSPIDLTAAERLHSCFHETRSMTGIPLKAALLGLFRCFLEDPFTYQAGLFLLQLPKPFAIQRIRAVAGLA